MRIKPGVQIDGMRTEALLGACVVDGVLRLRGSECIITSVKDGKHMVGSLHDKGRAFDCRTSQFRSPNLLPQIAQECREALGPEFDVVLETDHLHVEWDPESLKGKP